MLKPSCEEIPRGIKVAILYNSLDYVEGEAAGVSMAERGVLDQLKAVEEALNKLGIIYMTVAVGERFEDWLEKLVSCRPNVVFNLCEAVRGESRFEMNVACVLELAGIPYTGSPPLTLGICQNKAFTKNILVANGIPTPRHWVVTEMFEVTGEPQSFPVIVKPLREDGSIGINTNSVAKGPCQLATLVQRVVNTYRQPAIVEEYIDGRELNVAILGDTPPQPLPISEIVFSGNEEFKIVSYEGKWVKDSEAYKATVPVCPAQLDPDSTSKVVGIALNTYKTLGCRDYARVDIRLKEEIPYVIEVNPNPDISPDSGFARSLKAAGIEYTDLVERLISMAQRRITGKTS